jgi:hypothetical protein
VDDNESNGLRGFNPMMVAEDKLGDEVIFFNV